MNSLDTSHCRINRLTRSVVVLWNDGEKTISGTDVVQEDPIRVDVGADSSVVACSVLRSSRQVLNASCQRSATDAQIATISFSYLDPNDGLVVEILHTGMERYPTVKGTIRGIPQGPRSRGRVLSQKPLPIPFIGSRRAFAVLIIVVGISVSLAAALLPLFDSPITTAKTTVPKYALISAGALYVGIGGLIIWMLRRRYPRMLHGEELE